jgi:hypothetical protein
MTTQEEEYYKRKIKDLEFELIEAGQEIVRLQMENISLKKKLDKKENTEYND